MRAYVDTSVFGGAFDSEFKEDSERFFEQVRDGRIVVVLSSLTERELDSAPQNVRALVTSLPAGAVVRSSIDAKSQELAKEYVRQGAVSAQFFADALHIAMATMSTAELVVSWNFKHMVNIFRIRRYNSVNILLGYRAIEIRSPRDAVYE